MVNIEYKTKKGTIAKENGWLIQDQSKNFALLRSRQKKQVPQEELETLEKEILTASKQYRHERFNF